jgi:hypothetical protein
MKLIPLTMAVALVLGVTACAKAPQVEIDAANQALDDAQRAQAKDYASEAWTAAKDAEAKLQTELEAQKQSWAPLRSYQSAKQLAQLTKTEADRAAKEATDAKERTKLEVETMMTQARDAYAGAQEALAKAPRGKGTEADLASLKTDTASIEGTLQEMQQLYDAGDYLAAKTKAQAAIDASKQILTEIEDAKSRRRSA